MANGRWANVKELSISYNDVKNLLLTATQSMMSTYFGKITIVLKFPLTSAASAKGEQRKRGLPLGVWELGEGEREVLGGAFGVGDRRRGLRLRLENIFGI